MAVKQATSIDDQIVLLKKRGLIINDEEKAKENLLDIGYYRLGFYLFPFEKSYPKLGNRNHEYVSTAKFEDAVALYYLDFDLRNILLKYITRIEIAFRTYVAYYVSNQHKSSPTWFADKNIMRASYVKTFEDAVYSSIKKKPVIARHHSKYPIDKYAPAWKTVEYMTLGEVAILYSNLKELNERLNISKHFGVKQTPVFESYMESIRVLRNVCAHGSQLVDLRLPTSIRKGPAYRTKANDGQSLNAALHVTLYLLGCVSQNRKAELHDKIKDLLDEFSKNHSNLVHLVENATKISIKDF